MPKVARHGGKRSGAGAKPNSKKNGAPVPGYNLNRYLNLPPVAPPFQAVMPPQVVPPQAAIPPPPQVVANNPAAEAPPEWQREVDHQDRMDSPDASGAARETTSAMKGKGQNRRSGLLKKCMDSVNTEQYQKKALKMVRQGVLWDLPKTVLHGSQDIDMRKSWEPFHKLKIFNWFPFEMLPSFKVKCGTCGKSDSIKKDGMNNPPRLVFGEHENYILNAPQRLCCKRCKSMAATQKSNQIPKSERSQYIFLTTDESVLEQLACEEPGVFEAFPCFLSSKAGLDKECFDNIVDNAGKGIGPGAAAESIDRKHAARWQSKEIQWASHLRRRRKQPQPFDLPLIPVDQVHVLCLLSGFASLVLLLGNTLLP